MLNLKMRKMIARRRRKSSLSNWDVKADFFGSYIVYNLKTAKDLL
jgi:hypothetical protein